MIEINKTKKVNNTNSKTNQNHHHHQQTNKQAKRKVKHINKKYANKVIKSRNE